jgi:serine/threonine-protein phosphatase 4 regulatory subunit 1
MIFQVLVPISLKFCNDVVHKVRKTAAKRMHLVIEGLNAGIDDDYLTCVLENIKTFARSDRFNQR